MTAAILTGRSSYVSAALSPAQIGFLEAVAPKGFSVMRVGYPFTGEGEFDDASMVAASWRNARQVAESLYSRRFRDEVSGRLQWLVDRTENRLVLVTGSCGLQLANSVWERLRVRDGLRVDVVALGPACFGRLVVPATVVQGRADGWSQLFYRGRVDRYCACGHLDYWASGEVREMVKAMVR